MNALWAVMPRRIRESKGRGKDHEKDECVEKDGAEQFSSQNGAARYAVDKPISQRNEDLFNR